MDWIAVDKSFRRKGVRNDPEGWTTFLDEYPEGAPDEFFRFEENGLEISDYGRIRKPNGRITRGTLQHGKYTVKVNGVRLCVAKLVLKTFTGTLGGQGNYQDKGRVQWKDCDKTHNRDTNLEWDWSAGSPGISPAERKEQKCRTRPINLAYEANGALTPGTVQAAYGDVDFEWWRQHFPNKVAETRLRLFNNALDFNGLTLSSVTVEDRYAELLALSQAYSVQTQTSGQASAPT